MGDRRAFSINNSSSKQQFAFSKSDRFTGPKAYTNAFSYQIPGQFGHKKGANTGKGFSTSQARFKAQKDFSSPKIDGPGNIDRSGRQFGTTQQFSFGVSRVSMKKLYVDEILKNSDKKEPGPGNYERHPGFGNDAKESGVARYSMRQKDTSFERELKRHQKLPGPGNYTANDHLAGRQPCNSTMYAQPINAFSKAHDRFKVSGESHKTPAPAHYAPKNSLNENHSSQMKFAGGTRFGQDKRTFIDTNWNPKQQEKMPGPSNYNKFSDFGGMATDAKW